MTTHDTPRPPEIHDLSAFAYDLLHASLERARAFYAARDREAEALRSDAGGPLDDYRCPNGCGRHACHGRCSPNHDRPPRWERG